MTDNMNVPEFPLVPFKIDDGVGDFLKRLEKRIDEVEIVRVENQQIHVLGTKTEKRKILPDIIYKFHFVKNRENGYREFSSHRSSESERGFIGKLFSGFNLLDLLERIQKTKRHYDDIKRYKIDNLAEAYR